MHALTSKTRESVNRRISNLRYLGKSKSVTWKSRLTNEKF